MQKESAMTHFKIGKLAVVVTIALFTLAGGLAFAANNSPLTPELAAKKENHRRQKEQQINYDKRKAAAENLKAERLRVYQAKQAVKQ
jgi:hypothetical protein